MERQFAGRQAEQNHTHKCYGNGNPGLPGGVRFEHHHYQRHKNGVEIDQGGGQPGRDESVGFKQEQTAQGEQQAQHHQQPELIGLDAEGLTFKFHPHSHYNDRYRVSEKEHCGYGDTIGQQGLGKQRVHSV